MIIIITVSCSQVLITGRKQLVLVSDAELLNMSLQSYKQFIDSVPLSKDVVQTAMVKKTGAKIAAAVESFLKTNGHEAEITNFQWEFNLVKDTTVNAFCMPGGKVVFFEGILPVTKSEAGVAVVMGHEIAHAVANHSKERLSQQVLLSYGSSAADVLLSQQSEVTRYGIQTLYGLGAQLGVILPYSRKQEYEADRLGLIFMAMAGYDPNEAVAFWERMSANDPNSELEFM
ncbi:MAG: M48 family metallopeptidase, partial [Paludibacter sp.]|nr:M48 family metallopeptidase [Paludibacter sp.]